MEKRWMLKQLGDKSTIRKLSSALNINEHLSNLLVQRGIGTFEGARNFFRPEFSMLHDPFMMHDMKKAVFRIEQAIEREEKILIYGDYDVDGTTAVALLYTFLNEIYPNLAFYIPDRYLEGYGVSMNGIDFAANQNFSLIISLDCGIKANEQISYAKEKGIDFIVCDHHRPGAELPEAYAILDPKIPECNYPYKELSGCGVGFKLIQGIAVKRRISFEKLKKYLDLVVVSIAADIVPITGENRVLAYYGLKLINSKPRPGLEAILKYSGIIKKGKPGSSNIFAKELSISDLVFLVGPRINAAGRIESGKNSVKLLITEDYETASLIAEQINDYNNERRSLDALATQEALEMIAGNEQMLKMKSTVVYNPEWHKGVIGIVASRLTETYYRPTIVLTSSNGLITGSARSVKDFDVYDAIDACSDLLEHFGGHKYAAGLSFKTENLERFRERFEEVVASSIEERMLVPEIEIDARITLNVLNAKFYKILKQFAPFGPGNLAPTFESDGVVNTGFSKLVGNNHIKLHIVHRDISSLPFSGIAFQQGEHMEKIQRGLPFNIAYHLEENEWNGKVTLQINVKDIKFPDNNPEN